MFRLTPYGGVGAVTGANFLLEMGTKKVLVDCGLLQGVGDRDANIREFDYNPSSIDYLFVTHAHIDHIGKIPKLVKDGFRGAIYSTPETRAIAELMLLDAAKIAERNEREGEEKALFGIKDVGESLSLWKEISYHKTLELDEFRVEGFNAGHILGSTMYKFIHEGRSILCTHDLGNSPSPLEKDWEKVSADFVLVDSVYGDRRHEDKSDRVERLVRAIEQVIESEGTLLIPAFALDRTQVILYELDNIFEEGRVKSIPVFLDSPLAQKITDIYEKFSGNYNALVEGEIRGGDDIFRFKRLVETASARDSREIANIRGPKIIIAGSGMSTAGRIVYHEEIYLPDPKNMILFIGYQAPLTPGRQIIEGMKEVTIGEKRVRVEAKVLSIDGFSGHADTDALVEFIESVGKDLKRVYVAMGEPRASIFLAQRIRDELGVEAVVPELGKAYNL